MTCLASYAQDGRAQAQSQLSCLLASYGISLDVVCLTYRIMGLE